MKVWTGNEYSYFLSPDRTKSGLPFLCVDTPSNLYSPALSQLALHRISSGSLISTVSLERLRHRALGEFLNELLNRVIENLCNDRNMTLSNNDEL